MSKELIKKIFDTQDWIIGTISGGIEGPRVLLDIEETEDSFIVKYTWPEVCGLSDCPYHDTRAGEIYSEVYTIKGNKLLKDGSPKILETDGLGEKEKERVRVFLKDLGLDLVE